MVSFDSPEWQEISEAFTKAADDYQNECMNLWKSLSHDDRLKLFCAVSSLMYEGEIKQRGTYRYVLYDVFEFGTESYAAAQHAGYLSLHNAIFDGETVAETIEDFCTNHMDVSNDNLKEQISRFILKKHL